MYNGQTIRKVPSDVDGVRPMSAALMRHAGKKLMMQQLALPRTRSVNNEKHLSVRSNANHVIDCAANGIVMFFSEVLSLPGCSCADFSRRLGTSIVYSAVCLPADRFVTKLL